MHLWTQLNPHFSILRVQQWGSGLRFIYSFEICPVYLFKTGIKCLENDAGSVEQNK